MIRQLSRDNSGKDELTNTHHHPPQTRKEEHTMTHTTLTSPRTLKGAVSSSYRPGDVVAATDRHHTARKGFRPHLVLDQKGDRVYVVAITHTPQGWWATDQLGGGSYLALRDFKTGRWLGRWVSVEDCRMHRLQLSETTKDAALEACAEEQATTR